MFGLRERKKYRGRDERMKSEIAPQQYIENATQWIEVSIGNLSSNKSRQKWICRCVVEDLSTAKRRSRWIKDMSRIYQADRENRNLARRIEKAIEILLRRNPKISMDWEAVEMLLRRQRTQEFCSMERGSVKVSIEAKERKLDRNESAEDLLRSCQAWRNKVFKKGKNT